MALSALKGRKDARLSLLLATATRLIGTDRSTPLKEPCDITPYGMTLPLVRLTRSRPLVPTYATSTTWFHGMRRAYDTLKLCVVGHLNESGVGVLMPMLPSRSEKLTRCAVS